MKNKLIILLTLMLTTHYGLAEDEFDYFKVKGPVKQVTYFDHVRKETQQATSEGSKQVESIEWYNEDGCIAEVAQYDYLGNLEAGRIYTYDSIDNTYTIRWYDKSGNIQTDYSHYNCDANNKPLLLKRWYKNNSVYVADSMIYNIQGKLLQKYIKYVGREYVLSEDYKYDSLSRLTQYTSMEKGEPEFGYNVNYRKDGNIEKIHFNKESQNSYEVIYIYNKEKQLIKIKKPNEWSTFSDFDKYGNWLTVSWNYSYKGRNSSSIKTRIIEYYE